MTDQEWKSLGLEDEYARFARTLCYDQTADDVTDGEDPLAPSKGAWHGLLMVTPLWVAIGFVVFLIVRHR